MANTLQSEHYPTRSQKSCFSHKSDRFLAISRASRAYRSLIYSVIVFISFFLMLVFMTYNVGDIAQANCGVRLLTAFTGVFDSGNRGRSRRRELPLFRLWLGRRRKGDGLSLSHRPALTAGSLVAGRDLITHHGDSSLPIPTPFPLRCLPCMFFSRTHECTLLT